MEYPPSGFILIHNIIYKLTQGYFNVNVNKWAKKGKKTDICLASKVIDISEVYRLLNVRFTK
ncbi:MAG: hypothetical protein CVV21_08515 [Candidatus Goldiibacteriota bacterium HGW-Goldbacteria-1]|nr:MAG: hypothetical protein CVV21_08515 [Candidatus Goldiibacteriota bacterium HGW-Goldbacteria-1]